MTFLHNTVDQQWIVEQQIGRSIKEANAEAEATEKYGRHTLECERAIVRSFSHHSVSDARIDEIVLIRATNREANKIPNISAKERNQMTIDAFKKYEADGHVLTDIAVSEMKIWESKYVK